MFEVFALNAVTKQETSVGVFDDLTEARIEKSNLNKAETDWDIAYYVRNA